MRKPTWERLLLCSALLLGASNARADDEVAHRLTKFGKLSGGDTARITQAVSGRMKRAADMTSDSDPLRMAVSNALYGTPVSRDAMAAAKIRLRLYAGLNEWALENLFAARTGAMATCTTQFGLGKRDCQALLAAGGKVSLAEANKLGAGAPVTPMAPQQQQPAFAQGGAQQQSRFGGYNSGFTAQAPRYGAQPAPAYAAQPAYAAPARPAAAYAAPARPMQQPVAAARPVAAPMAAPPPSAASIAERKAEYERQRQAYLDRKKQEMAARKAKVVETAGGTERVARGPATEDEAAVMGVAPSAAAKAPAAQAPAKTAKAEAGAEDAPVASADAPAPAAEKPALDNGFLDGLLGDPLGKK